MINGNQLRFLRNFKGIDQTALAKILGKSQQYISRLEKRDTDEIPVYWVQKILTVLNCSEIELKKIKDILPPPHTF